MDIHQKVIRITEGYFEDDIDYLKLTNTTNEYKSLLNQICGHTLDIEEGRKNIEFNKGKALGTFWAALCLEDTSICSRYRQNH